MLAGSSAGGHHRGHQPPARDRAEVDALVMLGWSGRVALGAVAGGLEVVALVLASAGSGCRLSAARSPVPRSVAIGGRGTPLSRHLRIRVGSECIIEVIRAARRSSPRSSTASATGWPSRRRAPGSGLGELVAVGRQCSPMDSPPSARQQRWALSLVMLQCVRPGRRRHSGYHRGHPGRCRPPSRVNYRAQLGTQAQLGSEDGVGRRSRVTSMLGCSR